MGSKIISRESILDYIQNKSFQGVKDLLHSFQDKAELFSFLNFFQKNNEGTLSMIEDVTFHGSQEVLNVLTPNRSMGSEGVKEEKAYVYATDDPNYAIFLACLHLDQGGASVNAKSDETELFVDLDFVNGASKLTSGFVHVVSKADFDMVENREFRCEKSIEVICSIPVEPSDLSVPVYVMMESFD